MWDVNLRELRAQMDRERERRILRWRHDPIGCLARAFFLMACARYSIDEIAALKLADEIDRLKVAVMG